MQTSKQYLLYIAADAYPNNIFPQFQNSIVMKMSEIKYVTNLPDFRWLRDQWRKKDT